MTEQKTEKTFTPITSQEEFDERTKLLEAGWETRLRGGLIVWRKPGAGSWYSQRVAIELLEFLEEEKNRKDGST